MRTFLITCFGPFPGMPVNPTRRLLDALMRAQAARFARLGVRLVARELPTVFAGVAPELERLRRDVKPDALLHLGVAGGRRKISVEAYGRNCVTVLRTDASRARAEARALDLGPARITATFPARRIEAAMRARGLPAHLSPSAGDYVCNQALYLSLRAARRACAQIGFIHIPRARARRPLSRGADPRPGARQIATAVVEALLVMARTR